MRRLVFTILPLLLAALTFVLTKPSDEKCRETGIKRLATIDIKAAPGNIIIKDYWVIKLLRYAHNADTFKLGSGFFLQVKINDRKLEHIRNNIKP
jgi:hypothetical protein